MTGSFVPRSDSGIQADGFRSCSAPHSSCQWEGGKNRNSKAGIPSLASICKLSWSWTGRSIIEYGHCSQTELENASLCWTWVGHSCRNRGAEWIRDRDLHLYRVKPGLDLLWSVPAEWHSFLRSKDVELSALKVEVLLKEKKKEWELSVGEVMKGTHHRLFI